MVVEDEAWRQRTDRRFDTLEGDVSVLKQDVTVLKQDVTVLKQDVSTLKQDVSEVKQQVGRLETAVAVLSRDVRWLTWLVPVIVTIGMAYATAK